MADRIFYILCGGKSRRMGQDKALLEVNGQTLLDHWIERASPLFDEVVLLSGSARYSTSNRQLRDELKDAGPLSGLLTAMKDEKGQSDYFAIVAVDIPNLKDSTLEVLSKAIPDKSRAKIASCGDDKQPLTGIYHRKLADELTAYLNSDRRSVMGFIRETDPEYFDVSEEELLNINKPDAWHSFLKDFGSNSTGPPS